MSNHNKDDNFEITRVLIWAHVATTEVDTSCWNTCTRIPSN